MSAACITAASQGRRAFAGTAQAWLLRTAEWQGEWTWLRELVPSAQWQRFAGIVDAAKRRDRLLAAALHRWVLADALGLPPALLPLYRKDSGQPALALPGWTTSLSHARGCIAIALCGRGDVGIDIEHRRTPSLRAIADLVCSPAEHVRLQDDDAALLALWVRKEAALKAAGVGLETSMATFEAGQGDLVRLRGARGSEITVEVNTLPDTGEWLVAIAAPAGTTASWSWRHP